MLNYPEGVAVPIMAGRKLGAADFVPPQLVSEAHNHMPIVAYPAAVAKLCKWMRATECLHDAEKIETTGKWEYPSNLDSIPAEVIQKHLSDEERAALHLSPNFSHNRDWETTWQQTTLAWLAPRMRLSSWQRYFCTLSWNTFVRAVNWLHTLRFVDRRGNDIPWFLDAPRVAHREGYGLHLDNRYYDGSFAIVLVDYNNKPMVCIGFDVVDLASKGTLPAITIRQVQAVQRKNRELFRLGDDFFTALVAQLAQHNLQQGFQTHLIKGQALAKQYINTVSSQCERTRLYVERHRDSEADKARLAEAEQRLQHYQEIVAPHVCRTYAKRIPGFRRYRSQRPEYYQLKAV